MFRPEVSKFIYSKLLVINMPPSMLIKHSLNAAYMYVICGALLRKFDLALHDTTIRNVEMTRDNFIGQTDPGMNIVRVRALKEYLY